MAKTPETTEPAPNPAPAPSPAAPPPAPPAPSVPAKKAGPRIICKIVGNPPLIDGFRFATIRVGDEHVHVSEPLPGPSAERLMSMPDFVPCGVREDVVRPLFDEAVLAADAASQSAGTAASTPSAREAILEQQLNELQNANQSLAADIRAANERADRLEKTNVELAGQLAKAKAAGFVPSPK